MKRIKWPKAKDVSDWFWNLPPIHQITEWAKTSSLPGFFGVPIHDVLVFLFNEFRRFDLFTRANSIAYSFFLSLFPSLLTLFTLVPFLLSFFSGFLPELNNFNQIIQEEISKVMPGQAGDIVLQFVHDVTDQPRVGLLSFGFVLALYFSSNGMLAMMRSFEKTYRDTFKRRNSFRKYMVAVSLTFLVASLVIFSVVFIILGSMFIGWITELLNLTQFGTFLLGAIRWLAILMVFYFGIAILYRYGSATYRRFPVFSAGTTLATVLCVLFSMGFSFYVDEFNRYDTYHKFYGSIGTFIIIMLWIQMNSLSLLIGFELNAAIAVNRDLLQRQIDEE